MKKLLDVKKIIKIAGSYDGLSAKIAEKVGFDAVWSSGFCISASYAVPDISILTMTNMLERAVIMKDVISIPIIADCDSGYGNVVNAVRATSLFCQYGIKSICIEDKLFPKINSYIDTKQELRPINEFTNIIKACKDIGSNFDNFFFIARLEGLVTGSTVQEVVERADACYEAGADCLIVQSKKKDFKEIERFLLSFNNKLPVFLIPTAYPHISIEQMAALGVRGVIYANQSIRASTKIIFNILQRIIKDKTAENIENEMVSMKELFDIQNTDLYLKYLE